MRAHDGVAALRLVRRLDHTRGIMGRTNLSKMPGPVHDSQNDRVESHSGCEYPACRQAPVAACVPANEHAHDARVMIPGRSSCVLSSVPANAARVPFEHWHSIRQCLASDEKKIAPSPRPERVEADEESIRRVAIHMDDIGCQTYVGRGDTSTDLLLAAPDLTTTQLRTSIEEVRRAILQQETLLSELRSKQQELEQRLGLVVYPVLTLPNEIVSHIFVHCLPTGHDDRVRPAPEQAPLLLAQICHHWRVIALDTCELWSSVDLADRTHTEVQSLLESWFSRGKEHPLSLTLRGGKFTSPYSVGALISTVAHRLWRLEVSVTSISSAELAKTAGAFQIFANSCCLDRSQLQILTNPELLNLELYPMLTTLEVDDIPVAILHSILQRLPQLLHLTAHLNSTHTTRGTVTIAPSLQSLVLSGHYYRGQAPQCSNILEFLTLPGLRRLELIARDTFSSRPDFFRRSACALEHLTIPLDQGMTELADCLHAAPSVTSLVVKIDGADHEGISSLFRTLDTTPLPVPGLYKLVLRTLFPYLEYHSLVQVLRVRAANGLVSFQICSADCWRPHAGCLSSWTTLNADGVDLEAYYDNVFSWNVRDGGSYI
ncbi:hypothetical protein GGX14DRAFT_408303 [Mycena pura]|uniref:F-box domain-containing protein n=1 Tax=Mycena pura TaxID=153505 RepID=A0AAD6ULE7_9AGAR|nr:hypothetical protein GGX14DRAFT_408303 [Mycena pura]